MGPRFDSIARIAHSPAALLVAGLAAACDCGGGIERVAPSLGIEGDMVDFGPVAVGDEPAERTFVVRALTRSPLSLKASIEESDVPFAIGGDVPEGVDPLGEASIVLTFAPPAVETYAATLVIESDDPDRSRGVRRVLLSGQGRSPQITVRPDHLALSAVACPPTAHSPRCIDEGRAQDTAPDPDGKSIRIENAGEVPLRLGKVELRPAAGETAVPPNLALARLVSTSLLQPGEKLDLPLRWKPAPGQAPAGPVEYKAVVAIPSNDPAHPETLVPVTARAEPNAPPLACIALEKVTRRQLRTSPDGKTVVDPAAEVPTAEYSRTTAPQGVAGLRPAMSVHLTSAGCTTDPEGDVPSLTWSVEGPAASTARMDPDGRPQSVLLVDEPGDYTVTLVARDSLAQAASATFLVSVDPYDLSVTLGWSDSSAGADNVDLDLHLLGPDAAGAEGWKQSLFSCRDCFWFNPAPNWSFAPFEAASPVDNPRFFRDDQGTAGRVEQAVLAAAPAGAQLRVAVHYFSLAAEQTHPVTPVLALKLKGVDQAALSPAAPLERPGDTWFGALVSFPAAGGAPVVTPTQLRDAGREFDFREFQPCP